MQGIFDALLLTGEALIDEASDLRDKARELREHVLDITAAVRASVSNLADRCADRLLLEAMYLPWTADSCRARVSEVTDGIERLVLDALEEIILQYIE